MTAPPAASASLLHPCPSAPASSTASAATVSASSARRRRRRLDPGGRRVAVAHLGSKVRHTTHYGITAQWKSVIKSSPLNTHLGGEVRAPTSALEAALAQRLRLGRVCGRHGRPHLQRRLRRREGEHGTCALNTRLQPGWRMADLGGIA